MFHLIVCVITIVLALALVPALLTAVYHVLLLAASVLARQSPHEDGQPPETRFALLIPAHDEEKVIYHTVRCALAQDYPPELREVYVVADYCSDGTAAAAQAAGARCLERNSGERGRKGYALDWGMRSILASSKEFDAIVVIDADSHIEQTFLRAMDVALRAGKKVLQGQHIIRNPSHSSFAKLADLDMRLNNLLRNWAKMPLGASARLMGDAMCFSTETIARYSWPADSMTEDREYGAFLLMQGERIYYVPGARSYGQAAPQWKDATGQRMRWYHGVRQMRRSLRSHVVWGFLSRPSIALLDQALDLTLPPITTSAGLSLLGLLLLVLLPFGFSKLLLVLYSLLCIFWVMFPIIGLLAAHAPASTYMALLWAPYYLLWRLIIGIRTQFAAKSAAWKRTRRSEEIL